MKSTERPIAAEALSKSDEVSTKDWAQVPEIVIAVDDSKKWILIEGIAPITGPTLFRLVKVLTEPFLQDQAALKAVQNYRVISPRELSQLLSLGPGQTPGMQIRRVRTHFSEGVTRLYNDKIDNDAVIENVHGKDYRLNPRRVRTVAPDEIARG
jgi:hypothetical protein